MRRALTSGLVAVVAGLCLASMPSPSAAAPQGAAAPNRVERVLVFSMPRLTWADIDRYRPPALVNLLEGASLASSSHRTIGPLTSAGEGYATIGAGNRAAVDDFSAGLTLAPDEAFESTDAADAFTRRTGQPVERAAALHVGMPSLTFQNQRLLYGAEPGSLGQALADGGLSIAAIGNADTRLVPGSLDLHREVALAAIDRSGRLEDGRVDSELVVADPAAPFGVRLDLPVARAAFDDAWAHNDVVIVEASDLERADAYAGFATRSAGDDARRRALVATDSLLAHILRSVDFETDLVMVISPAAPRAREQLGVAAARGPGFDASWLRSATTRRDRFVTLPDVGPTILAALGVDKPGAMTGSLFRQGGSRPALDATFERLVDDRDIASFRDKATGPVSVAFIVFQVLIYALAAITLRWVPRLRTPVALCALAVLAMPSVAFLSGLFDYDRLGLVPYIVAFFAMSFALAGAARLAGGRHPLLPPLLLMGVALTVLLVDAATGARLQMNTVFGYSPVVAGRFAGYGNLAAALLIATAIALASGTWSVARLGSLNRDALATTGSPVGQRRDVVLFAATLLAVVIVFIGSPTLGSDVGGVLTTVPAFVIVVLLLAGVRISGRAVVLLVLATFLIIGGFAALDLARPEADQTHLARIVQRVAGTNEGGGATTVLRRKLATNLAILTSSVWTYLIPAALAFLGFLVWRPSGFLQALQRRIPGLRACLIGSLVAGILGFSLNDSGVAVPAMMFAVLLPYLTYLLIASDQ